METSSLLPGPHLVETRNHEAFSVVVEIAHLVPSPRAKIDEASWFYAFTSLSNKMHTYFFRELTG